MTKAQKYYFATFREVFRKTHISEEKRISGESNRKWKSNHPTISPKD